MRLDPKDDVAHSNLGFALVKSGNRPSLVEFHTACGLILKNADYKRNYDLLSRMMKQ